MQESLLSGNVSKVVLDIYSASTLKSYLNHPNIILEKVKRTRAAYGIALANEAKRIKGCVRKFMQENSRQALVNISDLTYLYQVKSTDLILRTMMFTMSNLLQRIEYRMK